MTPALRLAEFIAAISLATDLGMGQPLEQGLRTCLVSLELADAARVEEHVRHEVFYTALLRFLGCTANAHETAAVGGDDLALRAAIAPVLGATPPAFLKEVLPVLGRGLPAARRAALGASFLATGPARMRGGVRAHCEAAEMLATRLGLPAATRAALGAAFEQWNGHGFPQGVRGESIPLAARIVFIARDVEVIARLRGADIARAVLRERAGRSYDPALARAALGSLGQLLEAARTEMPWDVALRREPKPVAEIPAEQIDDVLAVFADFADLKEPERAGFSRDIAALAAEASPDHAPLLRRTGLVQDLGRVAVPNRPDGGREWSAADDERLRLHPYYSERILSRITTTAPLARIAGMHHERVDGSGYYRGAADGEIPWDARVLAAATSFRELLAGTATAPSLAAAADTLAGLAPEKLDADAVDAVLAAAGVRDRRTRPEWPSGLTEREVDVLRLICRGATKKDMAAALFIAPSTADHHIRHIYAKIGVSSRAAATLFAVERDLL
ncbi:HD domain-containing phosphohydrolase [Sinomonas sp. ASV322]|uniref:HD domain-containing phosphohydrolase n=1 Tax=Sinomonas sp. ASV322 TaxID=3041920 RepID=UPI0027DBD3B9|nr:HD domain-containing phosphohydrolase [Sinomonas sp. ASV322]MDQ4503775.1 HD domain-containing phosphohydrolase [Sinomonas sp. ASV322]